MIDLDLGTWAQDHIKMVGIHRVPTLTTENMSLIHEHMIEKSRVLLIKATDGSCLQGEKARIAMANQKMLQLNNNRSVPIQVKMYLH